MTKRQGLLLKFGGILAGVFLLLAVAAILVLQSAWFSDFVREKVIAAAEESTGGVVEIGSFQFDWTHLTVRIRNFVLHGTEPKGSAPLASVQLLEARLKLLTGFKKPLDVQYLGIQQPRVNFMVFADGKTNVPEPKVKKQSSNTNSGLETVVNLAVGQFRIQDGLLRYTQRDLQQQTSFSVQGENLHLGLDYNTLNPSYRGNLSIDPLLLTSGTAPPLRVRVNAPISIEKDAIRLADVRLNTAHSQVVFNGSLQNMNVPQISARVNATVSLPEVQRSFELPLDLKTKGSPQALTAEAAVQVNTGNNSVQIQSAHIALGRTTFEASGTLDKSPGSGARFTSNFALSELASLLKLSIQPSGDLQANGNAKLDPNNNYVVDGDLNSRGLAVRSGTTQIANVSLSSPFHADPFLISLDGFKINALGGSLAAKIFVEKLQRLSVEGSLRNFSLPVLAATLTGNRLGYDGSLNGSIKAQGDLKAKGTTGYTADVNIAIAPGTRGIPVSGRIAATYNGARDLIDLQKSFVALPNSRLDLSGSLNRQIDLALVSRNLNDFLPAANFGSKKPQTSLPVTLQGGSASLEAQVKGNLSNPQVTSHLGLDRFAVEQRSFDHLALDLTASSSGANVHRGSLTRKALRTDFDAALGLRKWNPLPSSALAANVTVRNGDMADLLSMAGQGSIPATGNVSADVHLSGTYGNPLGTASLQVVDASAYKQPIDHLQVNVTLADQLVTLSTLELAAAGGRLNVSGSFQHPRESFTVGHAQLHVLSTDIQLANIQPLQSQSPGAGGLVQLSADAAGDLHESGGQTEFSVGNINVDFSGRGLRVRNQNAGDLTATAKTNGRNVDYRVASDFAGSRIAVNGRTTLAKSYPTTADASIKNLSLDKALEIVGQGTLPVHGNLSADAHLAGTLQAPTADLQVSLLKALVYQEPINRLQGRVHYSNTSLDVSSLQLDVPAGSVTMAGSFIHPAGDISSGNLQLKLDSSDIAIEKFEHVRQTKPDLSGTLRLAADVSSAVRERNGRPELLLSRANANIAATRLRLGAQALGTAEFAAKSTGQNLTFRLDSDIAKSEIHGAGKSELAGDYPTSANLSFTNIRYANLAPFVAAEPDGRPPFDAVVEGKASFNGPALNLDDSSARLQLDRLEMRTLPQGSPTGAPPTRAAFFHNEGPIIVGLDHSNIRVQQLHVVGPKTTLNASGGMNLKEARSPLALNVDSNLDLGVLQEINRDFYSSGTVAMNATVRGTLSSPLVNGKVELKNANVNYADLPDGISNANGVILLNGTSAKIQNLTGESGGGKVALAGFVGYTGRSVNFNLRANADKVRVRYSGISVTSNADIALTGNTRRSLVSGSLIVQRIAYGASSDAGSFLSNASTPPSTPSAPSPVLAGMRLDIRVLTAPDLRVVTTYADRLSIEANVAVRGTAATPGMLGKVLVTDGQLVFFGNQYTVNTGVVNFYNPNAIQPVLNFSLETIAQNVDVVLGVAGTMNNLQLTYRSDPPLTFTQIVQLLATNTTPNDPTIAAHQPAPAQQSLEQMGASAVLGQAIANPLASRVQRVFGISSLKIDPSIAGVNGVPTAKVTLQQKIASNIMFTYITDVTQTNSQIIRVEWAATPKVSAVVLRDFNGNVSVQVFYKFKIR